VGANTNDVSELEITGYDQLEFTNTSLGFQIAGAGLDVTLTVTGFDNNGETGSETFQIDYATATLIELDDAIFGSVNFVEFRILDGTVVGDLSINKASFWIDDLPVVI